MVAIFNTLSFIIQLWQVMTATNQGKIRICYTYTCMSKSNNFPGMIKIRLALGFMYVPLKAIFKQLRSFLIHPAQCSSNFRKGQVHLKVFKSHLYFFGGLSAANHRRSLLRLTDQLI